MSETTQSPAPTEPTQTEPSSVSPVGGIGKTLGNAVGSDRARVDGPLKVTGTAPYAYEQPVENPAYLYPVIATVARGRITSIDDRAARAVPGVIDVLSHVNAPKLRLKVDPELWVLQDELVHYKGQFVAAVVAETAVAARHAASLVALTYAEEPAKLEFRHDDPERFDLKRVLYTKPGEERHGDVEAGLRAASCTVDAEFTTPMQFHSPLEPHPVIAIWHERSLLAPTAKRLTLFDANQGVVGHVGMLAPLFGLLPNQIEIFSPYVGGSFGSKGSPHPHLVLAALAAKAHPGRPVKYAVTRQQMFRTVGHRPPSWQRVRLGADAQGRLTAVEHEVVAPTARVKEYVEQSGLAARMMYATPNRHTVHRAVHLDIAPGTFMRAPGDSTGMFALETAMDELAHTLGMDPIDLRERNEPPVDPESGKPWSSRNLIGCLREGADRFGWSERQAPGQRRDGEWRIGMGVASAFYPIFHLVGMWARITYSGGHYVVALGAADLGTGAWTILPQIAADALGVPVERVRADIGRTGVPAAMIAGGSTGTYSWGNSVVAAAEKFVAKHGTKPVQGATAMARGGPPKGANKYARNSFGAHFAEVAVSSVTGEVRVRRMLGSYAAGTIINPRTARSQMVGGMTMGISSALHEEGYLDPRFGHVANGDFAGYHIAAHADIADLDVQFLPEHDKWFGATGAKGIGELGIVGVTAAVGNAIFNATGVRLRDLPFTPEKVLPLL